MCVFVGLILIDCIVYTIVIASLADDAWHVFTKGTLMTEFKAYIIVYK